MILRLDVRSRLLSVFAVSLALVQAQVLPPGFNRPGQATPPPAQQPKQQPPPQQPQPGQAPAPNQPAAPQQPPATTTPPTIAAAPAGGLNLRNASLTEVIDILARQLKINYILDPRVKGGVTINTYGETKNMDNRSLLDMILRINGAAMIQVGEIYRIVPLSEAQRLPIPPELDGKPVPEDDRTMLNLIFLKFATVEELTKLLDQFKGEHAIIWSYAPANLLIIQDSRRNMKRLMDLVSLFDSDAFANQRVRLFEVENGRPSDVAKDLEGIMKSISLNEKAATVKFLPVDRINTLIAVAPNPGVFVEVEKWLKKLDVAVESSSGSLNNYVYKVKYGFAPTLAMAIMGLYSNNPAYAMQMMMASYNMGMMGGGMGMGGMGMGMGGMYGGGMGMGGGMYGGGMYGGGMGSMYGGGMGMGGMGMGGMYPGYGYSSPAPSLPATGNVGAAGAAPPAPGAPGTDLTGSYLGALPPGAQPAGPRSPRIIPNPFDNTLLIQGTRQEYESILKLLRDIDVPPRQVLIEAKIYEVNLTGALSSGVAAFLRTRDGGGNAPGGLGRALTGELSQGSLGLSVGALVFKNHELLMAISAQEVAGKARVLSAPSVIATDSVPASINVGTDVPTITSQAVTGAQQGGTSLFANNVQNRNSGVTLQMTARVNPSGVVTMSIQQEVSAPVPPPPGADVGIASPSFSKRNIQTQVTVQDGDTIAIGGIINETNGSSTAGIPGLNRIPILGAAFGSRSYNRERTELIIFLTPRVIYDANDVIDATEELKSGLRRVSKYLRE
jgi:general secretion pathway protein D